VTDLLVIGYGNDLRSDDGAGRIVADTIETRSIAGVDVRSVSQLTPELALDIAGRQRVVFVDASVDTDVLSKEAVSAGDSDGSVMTHHGDPASLLSLVAHVGDQPGEAVVISIPASNLGLGFDLSEPTERAVAEAIELIVDMTAE
jgi:hydrogenase maturation protease